MKYLLVLLLLGAAPAAHRSQGYAGSTPVGLDGYSAIAKFDCARINAGQRRSHERIPLSQHCALDLPAPDHRMRVSAQPDPSGNGIVLRAGGLFIRRVGQPVTFLWNPWSTGFLLNDGEGSGQVSRLRYFVKQGRRWRESRALDRTATTLYKRTYDCRGGDASYVNVSGWDWVSSNRLRVIVQEGVHSAGCLQPHRDRNVLFEVIGDPTTGRIMSSSEIRSLP